MVHLEIKTPKSRYVAGETVALVGRSNVIRHGEPVVIQVFNPNGAAYRFDQTQISNNGDFFYEIRMGGLLGISGKYKIRATYIGEMAETEFLFANEEIGNTSVVIPFGAHIQSANKSFEPYYVKVPPQGTVTWVNLDDSPHFLVSGNPETRTADGKFNTGFIPKDGSSTVTINDVNSEITYFCALHPWEIGYIVVGEGHELVNKTESAVSHKEERTAGISFPSPDFDKIVESRARLAKLEAHFDPSKINLVDYDTIMQPHDRLLTIVFWDVTNYSELCDILRGNTNLLIEFLQEFYREAREVIFKHDGTLDKFVGDAAMGLFGVLGKDSEGKEDAIAAADAALELKVRFKVLRDKWIKLWSSHIARDIHIDLKCGMNTGTVTIGNMGTEKNNQFTALGSDVNIASRLAARASPNKIIISKTVRSRLDSSYDINSLTSINDIPHIHGSFEIFELRGKIRVIT